MLYLVGLPVGNWQDMPPRNLELLSSAKYLVVENEEIFDNIKERLNLQPSVEIIYIGTMREYKTLSNERRSTDRVLELLKSGEDVYVISDDGMPGIADPGEMITRKAVENGFDISATPGPSSIIAAVSVAGCQHNFSFEAFLTKNPEAEDIEFERLRQLNNKINKECPMVFMLRNYRSGPNQDEVIEVLSDMMKVWGHRNGVLCYNLTTPNESIVRGSLYKLIEYHKSNKSNGDDMVMLVIDGKTPMLSMPEV